LNRFEKEDFAIRDSVRDIFWQIRANLVQNHSENPKAMMSKSKIFASGGAGHIRSKGTISNIEKIRLRRC
jgi:hypothetical protein